MLVNPFHAYGTIVHGPNFIGRKYAIDTINQRIINAPDPGCLAIVGAPKTGKSSLAYHTLIFPRETLLKNQLITFRIDLSSSINSHQDLFRRLVRETLNVLEDFSLSSQLITVRGETLLSEDLSWLELQTQTQRFFRVVKKEGWRVTVVLDEFDLARSRFRDNEVAFQSLREIAYNPECKISLVTLSRRHLPEIATQSRADASTFPGIFQDYFLGCFSHKELAELVSKIEDAGIQENKKLCDYVWKLTSGHPYLASSFLFHFTSLGLSNNWANPEEAVLASKSEFAKYYVEVVNILREGNLMNDFLGLLNKHCSEVKLLGADILLKYGFIKEIDGFYRSFSVDFEEYITLMHQSVLCEESFPKELYPDERVFPKQEPNQNVYYYQTFLGHSLHASNLSEVGKIMSDNSSQDANKTLTGNFGVGINEGKIETEKLAGSIHESKPQNLAETAKDIQDLLKQLEESYPTETTAEKMEVATAAIKRIEGDPNWKARVIGALKEGSIESLKKAVDHPLGAFVFGAIEGWKTPE